VLGTRQRGENMTRVDANVILRYLLGDFVDALLYAHNKVHGDRIVTFDQKLIKLLNAD
jgi:predicted nucleic acid-binding protein